MQTIQAVNWSATPTQIAIDVGLIGVGINPAGDLACVSWVTNKGSTPFYKTSINGGAAWGAQGQVTPTSPQIPIYSPLLGVKIRTTNIRVIGKSISNDPVGWASLNSAASWFRTDFNILGSASAKDVAVSGNNLAYIERYEDFFNSHQ